MAQVLNNPRLCALLIEQSPVACAVFDTQLCYLACSDRWRSENGLEGRSLAGRAHYEIFPETPAAWREALGRALAGETLSRDADIFHRPDGSIDWVAWKALPWREPTGAIGGILLYTQPVTDTAERQRAATALQSELDILIERADQFAVTLLDRLGRVSKWNPGAQRMYGWRGDEIIGQGYAVMFSESDRRAGLPELQLASARRGGAFQGKALQLRKDRSEFVGSVTLNRIDEPDGAVAGFTLAVMDNTQDIERAQAAEADSAFHRALLETVPDAMVTIDEAGDILSFSATAEGMFGYGAAEVVGRNITLLMPEEEAVHHNDHLARYKATGERRVIGQQRRVMGRRKDGSLFPHALFVGEANGGGRRIFTGFLRDLTGQEEADRQLRELQAELLHISRVSALGTMAAALAHELNQPLTAIANYVQSSAALLEGSGRDRHQMLCEALEQAGKEALRAGGIVHHLREFVGRGSLERTVADPYDLVEQARQLAAVDARSRNITCQNLVSHRLPPVIVDTVEIQQVLLNLIRNAVEALGDHGRIVIAARREGELVHFWVKDNGPGIASGMEWSLFDPFISTKDDGMGMGLAICRTIIEAHSGKLWFAPGAQGGAIFHFTVPVAEVHDG